MSSFFKRLLSALLILMLFIPGALAADELPAISLGEIHASFQLPKNFSISLTPDTLEANEAWFASRQKKLDEVKKEFEDNHILFQAWTPEGDICLEITAVEDEWAKTYFDIEQQTAQLRGEYRANHLNDVFYPDYNFDSAEWQKSNKIGRFLMLKYVHRFGNDITHRGFAWRTIRNGYTITVDLKVYGRKLKGADNNILTKVMDSWAFTEILPLPLESAAQTIYYTQVPPSETYSGAFTVKGVAEADATVTATIMSWTRAEEPLTIDTVANKKGEFKMEVQLPAESTYGMSLTVTTPGGALYENLLFSTIVYDKKKIPVSFTGEFEAPSQTTQMRLVTNNDKVIMEGTSISGAKIQLMYDGKNIKKTVGGNGIFSFTIPTKLEEELEVTIAFSAKGGLQDRRFHFTIAREFTPSQRMAFIKEEAIKPSYKNLIEKLDGYTGRYMVYSLYPIEFNEVENNQWLVKMAMTSNKNGFKDMVYVLTDEMPTFTIESELRLYLECLGAYPNNLEEALPYFKWLFLD